MLWLNNQCCLIPFSQKINLVLYSKATEPQILAVKLVPNVKTDVVSLNLQGLGSRLAWKMAVVARQMFVFSVVVESGMSDNECELCS